MQGRVVDRGLRVRAHPLSPSVQAWRMEYEFEKECINQMARSTLKQHSAVFRSNNDMQQKYVVSIKIGEGYTYSKYNTLMHFLNVAECYWHNPDLNSIQVPLLDRIPYRSG